MKTITLIPISFKFAKAWINGDIDDISLVRSETPHIDEYRLYYAWNLEKEGITKSELRKLREILSKEYACGIICRVHPVSGNWFKRMIERADQVNFTKQGDYRIYISKSIILKPLKNHAGNSCEYRS